MRKPKKPTTERPRGCSICRGKPWVQVADGTSGRCTNLNCAAGTWYRQQDRARKGEKVAGIGPVYHREAL